MKNIIEIFMRDIGYVCIGVCASMAIRKIFRK